MFVSPSALWNVMGLCTYTCNCIFNVWADLVIYLIREGFVGDFGGREKIIFVSEMQIEKY